MVASKGISMPEPECCEVGRMYTPVRKFQIIGNDCRAVTMLEYAIMGSIIAAALILAVSPITNAVSADIQFMANQIPAQ
jgi:Flp pilus assembly pilin Flp